MPSKNRSRKGDPDLWPDPPAEPVSSDAGVNREPRVTVTLLIDATGSLAGVWGTYQAALRALFADCGRHPAARSSAFVSVGLCGPTFDPTPYAPFAAATLPEFAPRGGSPGGMWLNAGVAHLRAEHARMAADGISSNKELFLLVSDFHWDDPEMFDEAVEAYRTLESERPQFTGLMVLAGNNPNRDLAARVSRKRPPVRLDDLKIGELFKWVSEVVKRASVSRPGQSVEIPAPTWTLSDGDRT